MAETSDMRFLNVCMRLLAIFMAEPRWNPSNPLLTLANLQAALDGGYPVARDVEAKVAPFDIKVNNRQAAYAKIAPMVRASRRYLKSSGATEAEIADANSLINDILNQKSAPKLKLNPNQPGAVLENSHSTSHQSFDSRLGNLIGLRELYGNIIAYKPNEDGVKLTAFEAQITECQTTNEEIATAFVAALNAWHTRDAKLYNDIDSILELFRDAKEYYKSLYTPSDPQYKSVTARDLTLKNNSKR